MNLELNIAKRYLFSKKSTNAINIISLVSGAAMLFGTMALILVLSVFNGLEDLVKSLYAVFIRTLPLPHWKEKRSRPPRIYGKIKSHQLYRCVQFCTGRKCLAGIFRSSAYLHGKGVDKNYFNVVKKFDTFMVDGKKILQKTVSIIASLV